MANNGDFDEEAAIGNFWADAIYPRDFKDGSGKYLNIVTEEDGNTTVEYHPPYGCHTTGDGDLHDGDALGVCDGLDRVNEGKVSVKILNFESAGSKRKSPCAPLSLDRSRSHRGACRAVTRHHYRL